MKIQIISQETIETVYKNLQTGEIFTFKNGNENSIYLKIDSKIDDRYCVELNNGKQHFISTPNEEVIKVKGILQLTL